MSFLAGKGLAKRKQRTNLESHAYRMTRIAEVPADDGSNEVLLKATVKAHGHELVATRRVPADAPRAALEVEHQMRLDVAVEFANRVMGPVGEEEIASFPGSGAPGGPSDRPKVASSTTKSDPAGESSAGRTTSSAGDSLAGAPSSEKVASLTFYEGADGAIGFMVEFGGDEFDEQEPVHAAAVEAISALHALGTVENIELRGRGGTEPLLSSDTEVVRTM